MSTSSTSRSTRKRAAALIEAMSTEEPPVRRAHRDVLTTDLKTIKAELEHERSLRQLDAKRFQQVKQRLERQVEFAVEEAKEAKVMMDELREESERHMDQLRESRMQAQEELQDCQLLLEGERALGATACLEEKRRTTGTEAIIQAPARKRARPPACSVNAVNEVGIEAKQHRAPKIEDKTLHPYTGALACRLSQHVAHFPVRSKLKVQPKCTLHRWATGGGLYRAHVLECDQCKVCLCVDCFKVFHTEPDIVGIKGDLNRKYSEASEGKRNRARKEV
jgi:hypothetical protein